MKIQVEALQLSPAAIAPVTDLAKQWSIPADELRILDIELERLCLIATADGADRTPFRVNERTVPDTICRLEGLCRASAVLASFAAEFVEPRVAEAMGGPVSLFKDKINFKFPRGGKFGPHQDFAAYRHFLNGRFMTAVIALDAMTAYNGCLEFAKGLPDGMDWPLYPTIEGGPGHGEIFPETAQTLSWVSTPLAAGEMLLFNALIPHRSGQNHSSKPRRALFLTFNLFEDGDHYETYYNQRSETPQDPVFHFATPTIANTCSIGPA